MLNLPEASRPVGPILLSTVEKRIMAALKIYDEAINKQYIGTAEGFAAFADSVRFYASSLLLWLGMQELTQQVEHLRYAPLITNWMQQMIIKFMVYEHLDAKKWSDVKALYQEWHSFEKRSSPKFYKVIRDHKDELDSADFPYHKELERIWTGDPDQVQNIWKEVFPD